MSGSELKVVQEVDDDEEVYSEQENNPMGYGDEEEDDEISPRTTDYRLAHWTIYTALRLILVRPVASSPSRTPSPAPLPTHARRATLSREWSFPAEVAPQTASA
jgi:hypothetical protein